MDGRPILIVGVGGLGVPAALTLAKRGAGRIALMDPDLVELSNLPRQVIFSAAHVGLPKAVAAREQLKRRFPGLEIDCLPWALGPDNADSVVRRFGFVIDATDSPAAKFLINDRCVALQKPFVYGGVLGFSGQAMTVVPGRSACLRCLFEEPPQAGEAASCRQAGIVGPVAAAVGIVQADEAIRWLHGEPPALEGRLLTLEAANVARTRVIDVRARPGCPCGAAQRAQMSEDHELCRQP